MRSRLTTRVLTITATLTALLAIPAAAFAYAPTGDDFITCVAGGDLTVECTAGVFDPNSEVEVLVTLNPTLLDTTLTADADGVIAFSFDVPEGTESGDVTVTLTGTFDGEVKVLADAVATVTDGAVIANAGSDAGLLAAGALGALVVGGGVLYLSRRNRSDAAA